VVRLPMPAMTLLTDHISIFILPSAFLCDVGLYSQEYSRAILRCVVDGLESTKDEEAYAFMDDGSHGF
jgi:hypothetical protein